MAKARSARGEIIDFDLLAIKQQLAEAPVAIEVKRRQNHVTAKGSRSKAAQQLMQNSLLQPVIVGVQDVVGADEFEAEEDDK
jgi:hypothetical protein